MGMDVFGLEPTSEVGAYFRNNVWWWRPLWDYCCRLAPDLIPEDNGGHYNDGWSLDADAAKELAAKLKDELASGRCQHYAAAYARAIATLPLETCEFCEGTGTRSDAVGLEHGFPTRINPHTGQPGWCNGCDGLGTHPPFLAHYPFSPENVEAFAGFLEACGGFEIW
jgi:hypothetical protein